MSTYKDGDLIVGFRFHCDMGTEADSVRQGIDGTIVVDQAACSGPIYYWQPTEGLSLTRSDSSMGFAVCRGCRVMSGGGRAGRSDAVRRWAHLHRCELGKRLDEHAFFTAEDAERWVLP